MKLFYFPKSIIELIDNCLNPLSHFFNYQNTPCLGRPY